MRRDYSEIKALLFQLPLCYAYFVGEGRKMAGESRLFSHNISHNSSLLLAVFTVPAVRLLCCQVVELL